MCLGLIPSNTARRLFRTPLRAGDPHTYASWCPFPPTKLINFEGLCRQRVTSLISRTSSVLTNITNDIQVACGVGDHRRIQRLISLSGSACFCCSLKCSMRSTSVRNNAATIPCPPMQPGVTWNVKLLIRDWCFPSDRNQIQRAFNDTFFLP